MGYASWFYVETKSFEFSFEDGASVLRVFESRGSIRSVLGKVAVIWILATMEPLPQAEGEKEFMKSSRLGSKEFTVQCFANKFVCLFAVAEYKGGGDGEAWWSSRKAKG
jgi:hypothetical protein